MAGRRRWTHAFHAVAAGCLVLLAPAAAMEVSCPTATPHAAMPLAVTREQSTLRFHATRLGGFRIAIAAGAGLLAAPDALAAVERAAQQWEAVLSDPVTVTLDVDLEDLGESGPLGWAASFPLMVSYEGLRQRLVAGADADDGIVSLLPLPGALGVLLPVGFAASANILGSKASFKAAGFEDLDERFPEPDAVVRLNARFPLDFDARDGVAPGRFDLESIMVHEIGHALGFLSSVDVVDAAEPPASIMLHVLDLFRFRDQSATDPATGADFQRMPRSAVPGALEVFDDLAFEGPMSTGRIRGDGRQASHWKDDRLTGVRIGVMDPTLPAGERIAITTADLRALDAIGWDVVGNAQYDATTSTTSTSSTTTVTASSSTTVTVATTTTSTTLAGVDAPACAAEAAGPGAVRCRADLLQAALRDVPPDAFRTPAARRRLTRALGAVVARVRRLERAGESPRTLRAVRTAATQFVRTLRRLARRQLVDAGPGAQLAALAKELQ